MSIYNDYKAGRKARLDKARAKAQCEVENRREKAMMDARLSDNEMLGRKCIIGGNKKCTKDCVHFDPAMWYKSSANDGGSAWYGVHEARCKLWGDK